MSVAPKLCGCKGIRTCLLCEKQVNIIVDQLKCEQAAAVYSFCPHCNLCWPDGNSEKQSPLYLGQLRLVLEFLSAEEESNAISAIDSMAWLPSQSGRRKQDFGPKVNFKKKKTKIGSFKGFPRFSENILKKFRSIPEISDFEPVELCNLEYTPERGSAIDPHVDDAWLWGERLVTVNLASSTVLMLTPANFNNCGCTQQFKILHRSSKAFIPKSTNLCDHFNEGLTLTEGLLKDACNNSHFVQTSVDDDSTTYIRNIKAMCEEFREPDKPNVVVRVVLPPRSLLVLAGCARHNWFHEIKRDDVKSRRLAMTFRELSSQFLDGGSEKEFGDQLLAVASNFCDFD